MAVNNTNEQVVTTTNTNVSDATSTTDVLDTSDWKTYRNEEYGFEFKHSEDWSIGDRDQYSVVRAIYYEDRFPIASFIVHPAWETFDYRLSYLQLVPRYLDLLYRLKGVDYPNAVKVMSNDEYLHHNNIIFFPKSSAFVAQDPFWGASFNFFLIPESLPSTFIPSIPIFDFYYSVFEGDGFTRTTDQAKRASDQLKAILKTFSFTKGFDENSMLSFYNNQRLGLSFLYDTVAWHNKQPNIVYSQGNSVHIRTKGSQSGYELRVYDLKGATPEQFINKEFIQHTSNCKFTNTTGFTHRENSIVSLYFKFEITNMGVDALSEVDCGPFGYQTNHANFFLYNPESRNKLLWVSVPSKEAEVVPILHLVKFFESLTIY